MEENTQTTDAEAAKLAAKVSADAAKAEAKVASDAAKVQAKADRDAAKLVAKEAKDKATAEAKAAKELKKSEADAAKLAAKAEEDAAKANAPPVVKKPKAFNMAPQTELKKFRDGTKRAQIIGLMLREGGATFNELMTETGWDDKTAYEGVRLINLYVGYGLKTSEDGHISAWFPTSTTVPSEPVPEAEQATE